jgi:pheromone shutdown protein TraB
MKEQKNNKRNNKTTDETTKNQKKSKFTYLLSYDFILNANLFFLIVYCITLLCDFKLALIINSIITIITDFTFFTCQLINNIKKQK